MKYLYKYPQAAYPYADLVETNRRRSREEPEYELLDTGVFDDDRYFDVFVEYAKAAAEDLLIRISVCNRGPEAAPLHLLPTLWFRNTWSWADGGSKPVLSRDQPGRPGHYPCPPYRLRCSRNPSTTTTSIAKANAPLLFTENETNHERLFGSPNAGPYVKDGIDNYLVHNRQDAVNPRRPGPRRRRTTSCPSPAGATQTVRLRLTRHRPRRGRRPLRRFRRPVRRPACRGRRILCERSPRAPSRLTRTAPTSCARRWPACSGPSSTSTTIWTSGWRNTTGRRRSSATRMRNGEWFHMFNDDIISMPDKWEYPWYAAWDLAFHMLPLAIVDPDFAKPQLDLMLRNDYLHPNGQLPAYEWNFGDVNPPVHA